MALIPLIDCYELLDIDPKTLRTYLKRAGIQLSPHPTDGRIKCLTSEQVTTLAALAERPLRPNVPTDADPPPAQAAPASPRDADPLQRISELESKVVILAEQLAGLAMALLQERDHAFESRISAVETTLTALMGATCVSLTQPEPSLGESQNSPHRLAKRTLQLNPAEQLARSRMPPLIEYNQQGTYVIVSSQQGELCLVPDSAEWFDWLATLSSFRFVGKSGRFTAYRESRRGGPTRTWTAHLCFHHQRYKYCLGVTDKLNIPRLEEIAAKLRADADLL